MQQQIVFFTIADPDLYRGNRANYEQITLYICSNL